MGWKNNDYHYAVRTLQAIASCYFDLYDGLALSDNAEVTLLQELAEYKADFDTALNSIGRGRWDGRDRDFKRYGRLQQSVLADVLSIAMSDSNADRLRRLAYHLMKVELNGDS